MIYHAPLRTISHVCHIVHLTHPICEKFVLKHLFLLCENAWSPWQPIMRFSRMGCTYKVNHISPSTYSRLLKLVPDKSLDTCHLSHGELCKLSYANYHICIFIIMFAYSRILMKTLKHEGISWKDPKINRFHAQNHHCCMSLFIRPCVHSTLSTMNISETRRPIAIIFYLKHR